MLALLCSKTHSLFEKKTPEAAAHRSTGLLSKTVGFLVKTRSFLRGGETAGGRRAQKYRAFCHKSVLLTQQTFLFVFFLGGKRRRPPCAGAQDFCQQKCGFCSKNIIWGGGNAGGRRAQEHRAFVKKVWFLLKHVFFVGGKNAGGRHAQEHRTFAKKREVSAKQTCCLSRNHICLTKVLCSCARRPPACLFFSKNKVC